jgi:hypothetical protein
MAKAATQDTVIGALGRTKREELRVTLRKSNGVTWLDLRIYYQSESGQMLPSQRGISVSGKELQQLRTILQKLYRERDGESAAATADSPRVK